MSSHAPKKILLLAASLGAGHVRAAEATATALRTLDPACRVEVLDIQPLISPLLWFTQFWGYEFLIEYVPWIWRWLYRSPWMQRRKFAAPKMLMTHGHRRLLERIVAAAPDVIISTQINCHELAYLFSRKLRLPARRVTVVTDYDAHPIWSKLPADLLVVAHQELADHLIRLGVCRHHIEAFGIPIDPVFQKPLDRDTLFSQFDLKPDCPTALVMGGSVGFGELDGVVRALLECPMSLQVLAVAGHNKTLHQRLEILQREHQRKAASDPGGTLQVFGFVDFMPALMTLADFFVTKPGGLATSEALAKGLPMLFVNPIAGHEEGNADFFVRHKAAIAIREMSQLIPTVQALFENQKKKLCDLHFRAQALAKPDAAIRLAEKILQL